MATAAVKKAAKKKTAAKKKKTVKKPVKKPVVKKPAVKKPTAPKTVVSPTGTIFTPEKWQEQQALYAATLDDASESADISAEATNATLDAQQNLSTLKRQRDLGKLDVAQERDVFNRERNVQQKDLNTGLGYRGMLRGSAALRGSSDLITAQTTQANALKQRESTLEQDYLMGVTDTNTRKAARLANVARRRQALSDRASAYNNYIKGSTPKKNTGVTAPTVKKTNTPKKTTATKKVVAAAKKKTAKKKVKK